MTLLRSGAASARPFCCPAAVVAWLGPCRHGAAERNVTPSGMCCPVGAEGRSYPPRQPAAASSPSLRVERDMAPGPVRTAVFKPRLVASVPGLLEPPTGGAVRSCSLYAVLLVARCGGVYSWCGVLWVCCRRLTVGVRQVLWRCHPPPPCRHLPVLCSPSAPSIVSVCCRPDIASSQPCDVPASAGCARRGHGFGSCSQHRLLLFSLLCICGGCAIDWSFSYRSPAASHDRRHGCCGCFHPPPTARRCVRSDCSACRSGRVWSGCRGAGLRDA